MSDFLLAKSSGVEEFVPSFLGNWMAVFFKGDFKLMDINEPQRLEFPGMFFCFTKSDHFPNTFD